MAHLTLRKTVLVLLMGACLTGCMRPADLPPSAPALPSSTPQPSPAASKQATLELPPPPAAPQGAIPLIFSHDGAPDDIATMVYLANHPGIQLLAVIQSYGEQHPTRSLRAWQVFIYDVLDLDDVPIGIGSVSPLDPAGNQFPADWRDGADAFWGVSLPHASADHDAFRGVDLIIDRLALAPEPVTILITGAQTDLALALQRDPAIKDKIAQVVIMGGAFHVPGNLGEASGNADNDSAEWNIFVDALAAKQVFNAGIPITVVSLDGSDNLRITQTDLDSIADSSKPGLGVMRELWERSLGWSGGAFKIWDIVAAVAVTHPQHFSWEYDALDVIAEAGSTHGQTIALGTGSASARYTLAADFAAIRAQIFSILQ